MMPAPCSTGLELLAVLGTQNVIGADSSLEETVDRVMRDSGLACLPAREF
ncbi:hypothetical protein [Streptomyces sp. NPDC059928]